MSSHKILKSYEIRQRFLDFFANKKRGSHAILPSASLVPENDPSVLFNTAGMQPLVPYLMGQKHPLGNRLASCQKCVRTGDLDDIGDNRHFSFFEMLGNWSLGDYFKDEAIVWSYEFLTSADEGLGLDPTRLAVTIFAGDENAPYDQESKDIWMSLGIPEHRIYALPADDNWWSPGDNGPCGPCSEMFYDMEGDFIGQEISHEKFIELVQKEKFIEIWNDVFMEYEKRDGKVIGKLAQKNVDTGAGLERLTAVMQGKNTAYDTDLFKPARDAIRIEPLSPIDKFTGKFLNENIKYKSERIALDHFRTALFMAADGVVPSNKDRGYIMRRLIRRGVVYFQKISASSISHYKSFFKNIISPYTNRYLELQEDINPILFSEIEKFQKTLDQGLREFEKIIQKEFFIKNNQPAEKIGFITGEDAFDLLQTFGFPIEMTIELAGERGFKVDINHFNLLQEKHAQKSRSASAGMFKGGLANTNEKTVQLHTAHHLLLAALQQVLGPEVKQRGSNITEERLRIDFTFDRKMTDEEKLQVEKIVNEKIQEKLPVMRKEMKREDAEKIGAQMEFGAKYPDMVSVYMIGGEDAHAFSKEFCGGPHVHNTSELGHFKIQKEEASSAGVRRIKAVLQ